MEAPRSSLGPPWSDPAIPQRERKRMPRLLIEDFTLNKGRQSHPPRRPFPGWGKDHYCPGPADELARSSDRPPRCPGCSRSPPRRAHRRPSCQNGQPGRPRLGHRPGLHAENCATPMRFNGLPTSNDWGAGSSQWPNFSPPGVAHFDDKSLGPPAVSRRDSNFFEPRRLTTYLKCPALLLISCRRLQIHSCHLVASGGGRRRDGDGFGRRDSDHGPNARRYGRRR